MDNLEGLVPGPSPSPPLQTIDSQPIPSASSATQNTHSNLPLVSNYQTPEAGPSTSTAPPRHLPQTQYASIEYPGPISHPSAILGVISQSAINECFNSPVNTNALLEMNYRADQMGAPIRGYRVPSQKLLLKVVKKRRKVRDVEEAESSDPLNGNGKGKEKEEGVFTAEVVGPVSQTVRFRSMADYHYTPNVDGPTAELVGALRDLDYYELPPLNEIYVNPTTPPSGYGEPDPELCNKSLLDLQPIPLHSYTRLPPIYNWKMPAASIAEDWEDPRTGEIKKRYVNKSRFVGFGPTIIGHTTPLGHVPSEPVKGVQERLQKLDQALIEKLKQLFEQQPVWTRYALLTNLNSAEIRELTLQKFYIPAVCYTFGAGPYWKCLVKLGYDPRQHVEARNRNNVLGQETPPPTTERDEEEGEGRQLDWEEQQVKLVEMGKRPPVDRSRGHIFDGQVLHRARPDYQLCYITDPLVVKYLEDPDGVVDVCDARDGWYKPLLLELVRSMVRTKYIYLRNHGEAPKDSICYELIEEYERNLLAQKEGEQDADGDQVMTTTG